MRQVPTPSSDLLVLGERCLEIVWDCLLRKQLFEPVTSIVGLVDGYVVDRPLQRLCFGEVPGDEVGHGEVPEARDVAESPRLFKTNYGGDWCGRRWSG